MAWTPGAAGPDSDAHATSSVRYASDATLVINTRFMACLPSASAAEWPALATSSRGAAWWVHARFTVVASIAATVRPVGPAGGVVQALFEGGDSPTLLYAIA